MEVQESQRTGGPRCGRDTCSRARTRGKGPRGPGACVLVLGLEVRFCLSPERPLPSGRPRGTGGRVLCVAVMVSRPLDRCPCLLVICLWLEFSLVLPKFTDLCLWPYLEKGSLQM